MFGVLQEKEDLQNQVNRLQKQVTANVQETKRIEANGKLEVESSKNALLNFKANHKDEINLLQVKL